MVNNWSCILFAQRLVVRKFYRLYAGCESKLTNLALEVLNVGRFIRFFCLVTTIVLLCFQFRVEACTLWASAGDSVVGGGTIISKNRDWLPDHQQQLRLFTQNGYRYLTLYADGNKFPGNKAGINEKGFAVVSASPPSYLDKPENFAGKTGMRTLLSRYDSVASAIDALEAGKWVCGPEFLVLSDRKEIVCIEFGINGSYDVISRTSSGSVYHTNHYLSQSFIALNQGALANSQSRYNKIKGLLEKKEKYDVKDFQQYSADSVLWRLGATPTSTRTMSSWIIRQSPEGEAVLYLKMSNPGKTVKDYEFPLDDLFAGKVDLSQIE